MRTLLATTLKLVVSIFFAVTLTYGQFSTWNFTGNNSANATFPATGFDSRLVSTSGASNITRGATASAVASANSFSTNGFGNNGISTANTDYFQITLSPTGSNRLSIYQINATLAGTASFAAAPGVSSQFAYSLDGVNFTLIDSPQVKIGSPQTLTEISTSGIAALQNILAGTTVTIRYYASGQTTNGTWGLNSASSTSPGLAIDGVISLLDITNPNLLIGYLSVPYTIPLNTIGGIPPYTYSVVDGSVPPGLTLNSNGTWSGIPNQVGAYSFDVVVTDSTPFAINLEDPLDKMFSPSSPNFKRESFYFPIKGPTASASIVRGRLVTPSGRGLANSQVVLTNTRSGEISYARSGSFGNFTFEDLPTGDFYILDVPSKKYRFNQTSFTLNGDLTDLVLVAER
jgi:hypothetical protein